MCSTLFFKERSCMINNFSGIHAFLSNFFDIPQNIEIEGMFYPNVENAFHAMKSLDYAERFLFTSRDPGEEPRELTPGQAKRAGKKLILRPDWEEVKFEVMEQCLRKKFSLEPFNKLLADTGEEYLLEGNIHHDNIWGSCLCPYCIDVKGQNHLGRLLMKIRKEIV